MICSVVNFCPVQWNFLHSGVMCVSISSLPLNLVEIAGSVWYPGGKTNGIIS